MTADEILRDLRAQPFQPFRFILNDGTTYDVRYPDHCLTTRTLVIVGIPHPRRSLMQRAVYVSIDTICGKEPLTPA